MKMLGNIIKTLFLKKDKVRKKPTLLSPKKITDKGSIEFYTEKLKDLLNEDDALNIALSGSYGTGKSSIIKTFIAENKQYKSIIISISSFLKEELDSKSPSENTNQSQNEMKIVEDNNSQNNKNISEKNRCKGTINDDDSDRKLSANELEIVDKIEKSILKQLVYRNSEEQMNQSGLGRINISNHIRTKFSIIYDFTIFIMIIISILIYKYYNIIINYIPLYLRKIELPKNFEFYFFGMLAFIFIITIIYNVYNFIDNITSKNSISKLKLANYEIDLYNKEDLTFSKHMKEIIYFFIKNKYEIIVFEDIDRFKKDIIIKVMEELKELNTILNSAAGIKKKIRFIYLFKDSIFEDYNERSKFYDYILSVLPISSASNSLVQLTSLLIEKDLRKYLNPKIIGIVSSEITDMRTLINIVNDFEIFKDILNTADPNKIFAMSAFKNYYISDYEKVLKGEDIISQKIYKINFAKSEKIEELKKEIRKKKDELIKLESLKGIEKNTLKHALWSINAISNGYSQYFINANNRRITKEEFLSDEFNINDLRNSFFYNNTNKKSINYGEYEDVEKYIKLYNSLGIEMYNEKSDEIRNIQREINNLEKMSFSEAYNKYIEDTTDDLLTKLIGNSYIEEDYISYVTAPPINKNLSKNDCNFMFTVTHNKMNLYGIVENVGLVTDFLQGYFEKETILNIDYIKKIMDELQSFNNSKQLLSEAFNRIINQFKNMSFNKLLFLEVLYANNQFYFIEFTKKIHEKGIILWDEIQLISNIDELEKFKKTVSLATLIHTDNIEEITEKEKLIKYIDANYTNIDFEYIINQREDEIEVFKKLKIQFTDITRFDDEAKQIIFENGLYKVNIYNIVNLMKTSLDNLNYNMLTREEKGKQLINHIRANLNDFGNEVYLKSLYKINNQNVVKRIINDYQVSKEFKKELYIREEFKLPIDKITEENVEFCLNYNHITPTWNNIKKLLDITSRENAYKYVLENISTLTNEKNIEGINKLSIDTITELVNYLLDNNNYINTIAILNQIKSKNQIKKGNIIKDEKIESVSIKIQNNIVEFNKRNLNKVKEYSDEELLKEFIKNWIENKNISSIIKELNNIEDVKKYILLSNDYNDDQKIEIINNHYKNISTTKLVEILKEVFPTKTTIKYRPCYINNIFRKLETEFEVSYSKEYISFKVKK